MNFYDTVGGKRFIETTQANIREIKESQKGILDILKERLEEQKKTNELLAQMADALRYLR